MTGFDDLDAMIGSLRRLGTMPAYVAKIGAPLVEEAIKATARAGTTPDGKPWPPKKDGGAPLVHAADAISTKAAGTTIITTLTGPEVIHDKGDSRLPRRQILPDGGAGLPAKVGEAVQKACDKAFENAMRGGR